MAFYVRMRRNGRKVGELGPFTTQALAVRQAQPFADEAAAGVVVSVEATQPKRNTGSDARNAAIVAAITARAQTRFDRSAARIARGGTDRGTPELYFELGSASLTALMGVAVRDGIGSYGAGVTAANRTKIVAALRANGFSVTQNSTSPDKNGKKRFLSLTVKPKPKRNPSRKKKPRRRNPAVPSLKWRRVQDKLDGVNTGTHSYVAGTYTIGRIQVRPTVYAVWADSTSPGIGQTLSLREAKELAARHAATSRKRNPIGVMSMRAGWYYTRATGSGIRYFRPSASAQRDSGGWLKGLTARFVPHGHPSGPAMKDSIEKRDMRMWSPIKAADLPATVRAAFADPILSSKDPRLRRNPGTSPRAPKKSQSAMKRLGRRIKLGALNAAAPKFVRRPALAFGFALMDPKVAMVDKYLAVGGSAPLAVADGPLPIGDLMAAGITVTKMTRLAKARHYKRADAALARI